MNILIYLDSTSLFFLRDTPEYQAYLIETQGQDPLPPEETLE